MNGGQEIKTPIREDSKLHPLEYPAGSSPHTNKERCDTNMARQAEG